MMKLKLPLLAICIIFMAACSESEPEKKTDIAQELAAKQMVGEAKLLIAQGKMKQAADLASKLQKKYGHTKVYAKAKAQFMRGGVSAKDQKIVLTSTRLIKLENALLAFRAETGDWPDPGQLPKPLDAWNNELYWIIGEPENSYDMLIVSAGPDGKPGTDDEVIMVWTQDDIGGYKNKQTGEIVGKKKKSTAKKKDRTPQVMTMDDLMKKEKENGTPSEKMLTLDQLGSAGKRSRSAGQPKKGEMVLSLDEIKEKL